jgi:hypothetical protein
MLRVLHQSPLRSAPSARAARQEVCVLLHGLPEACRRESSTVGAARRGGAGASNPVYAPPARTEVLRARSRTRGSCWSATRSTQGSTRHVPSSQLSHRTIRAETAPRVPSAARSGAPGRRSCVQPLRWDAPPMIFPTPPACVPRTQLHEGPLQWVRVPSLGDAQHDRRARAAPLAGLGLTTIPNPFHSLSTPSRRARSMLRTA